MTRSPFNGWLAILVGFAAFTTPAQADRWHYRIGTGGDPTLVVFDVSHDRYVRIETPRQIRLIDFAAGHATDWAQGDGAIGCRRPMMALLADYHYRIHTRRLILGPAAAATVDARQPLSEPDQHLVGLALALVAGMAPGAARTDAGIAAHFVLAQTPQATTPALTGRLVQHEPVGVPAVMPDRVQPAVLCQTPPGRLRALLETVTAAVARDPQPPVSSLPVPQPDGALDRFVAALSTIAAAGDDPCGKQPEACADLATLSEQNRGDPRVGWIVAAADPAAADPLGLLAQSTEIDWSDLAQAWWIDWLRAGLIVQAHDRGLKPPPAQRDPLPFYLAVAERSGDFPPVYGELGDYFARALQFDLAWAFYDAGRARFGAHPAFAAAEGLEAGFRQDYPGYFPGAAGDGAIGQ